MSFTEVMPNSSQLPTVFADKRFVMFSLLQNWIIGTFCVFGLAATFLRWFPEYVLK